MHNLYIRIALILVVIVYLAFPFFTVPFDSNLHLYLINPLMWIGLGLATYFLLSRRSRKFNFEKYNIRNIVLMGSLIFIIIYFGSGLLLGFSKSPYNRTLLGFLKNFWIIIFVPLLHEIVREGFVSSIKNKDKWFVLITITIFFAFAELGITDWAQIFESRATLVGFLLSDFALAIISSAFLTYLSYKEGFMSALIYKIPIAVSFIAAPVFPNNADVFLTILQIVIPISLYLKIEDLSDYKTVFEKQEKVRTGERILNIIYLSVILLIGVFSLGLLPYYPVVILSDSMYPGIKRGDIVISKKIDIKEVYVDDIIVYDLDNNFIIHRVKEIKRKIGNTYLITKGDNNKTPDARLVTSNQVKAKVYFTVPKVGYPTIIIRELLFGDNKNVDIKRGDL